MDRETQDIVVSSQPVTIPVPDNKSVSILPTNGKDISSYFDLFDGEDHDSPSTPTPPPIVERPKVGQKEPAAAGSGSEGMHAATPPARTSTQAPPVAAAATPPAAPAGHPQYLLEAADEFLELDADIANTIPAETLQQMILKEKRSLRRTRQENGAESAATHAANKNGVQPAPAVETPPPEPVIEWGTHEVEDEFGRKAPRTFTDEDIHPPILSAFRAMAKKIASLEGFIAKVNERAKQNAVQQQQNRLQSNFDSAFDSMPKFFGQGTAKSLEGKPELQRRVAAYHAVMGMTKGWPDEQKAKVLSNPEGVKNLIRTYVSYTYGDAAPVAAAATAVPAVEPSRPTDGQWVGGSLVAPTARRDNGLANGKAKARAAVAEYWDELKNQADDQETAEDDFFDFN